MGVMTSLFDAGDFSELAHLYRTAPVGLCLVDRQFRFVRINEQMAAINGKPVAEHIGKSIRDVIPEIADQVEGAYRSVFETGRPLLDVEIHGQTSASPGETRCWQVSHHPLRAEDGSITGVTTVVLDITERKSAETELVRQQEDLEQRVAQRTTELAQSRELIDRAARLVSIGTFAAGIAHQINNPLGGILLAAQSAQLAPQDTGMVEAALGDIVADVKRCGDIVRALLRFAREETLRQTRQDLNQVVRSVAGRVRDRPGAESVSIEQRLVEPAPEVQLNADGLREVLAIAIGNSADAGARHVVLTTEVDGDWARVEVADDGRGVTEEQARRAFEPFFTTRQGSGGTGLGLSIAHGIISQHGGSIAIAPGESGVGATLTIRLRFEASGSEQALMP